MAEWWESSPVVEQGNWWDQSPIVQTAKELELAGQARTGTLDLTPEGNWADPERQDWANARQKEYQAQIKAAQVHAPADYSPLSVGGFDLITNADQAFRADQAMKQYQEQLRIDAIASKLEDSPVGSAGLVRSGLLGLAQAGGSRAGLFYSALSGIDAAVGDDEGANYWTKKREENYQTSQDLSRANTRLTEWQGAWFPGLHQAMESGVRSLGEMLSTPGAVLGGGLTNGARFAIQAGAAGLTRANDAYEEARKADFTDTGKIAYATAQGLIEGGLSEIFSIFGAPGKEALFAGEGLAKRGLKEALKLLGKHTLEENVEEQAQEFADQYLQKMVGIDPNEWSLGEVVNLAKQTFLSTAVTMGLGGSPKIAAAAYDSTFQPKKVAEYNERVEEFEGFPVDRQLNKLAEHLFFHNRDIFNSLAGRDELDQSDLENIGQQVYGQPFSKTRPKQRKKFLDTIKGIAELDKELGGISPMPAEEEWTGKKPQYPYGPSPNQVTEDDYPWFNPDGMQDGGAFQGQQVGVMPPESVPVAPTPVETPTATDVDQSLPTPTKVDQSLPIEPPTAALPPEITIPNEEPSVSPEQAPEPPQVEPTPLPEPESSPQPQPAPETTQDDTPDFRLAEKLYQHLKTHGKIDAAGLFSMANAEYGGTRAEGKYGPSDVYDSLEVAAARLMHDWQLNPKDAKGAKAAVEVIGFWLKGLPTQTNRSGDEKVKLQQFSTPPQYAMVAAYAAGIQPGEIVLEPSAGTGSLVTAAQNYGGKVYANEWSKRRGNLLRQVGPEAVFNVDAEHLPNLLHGKMQKPSVIIMNPPFSNSAALEGKKVRGTDHKHVDQALKFLAPNGRLVAIIGAPLHGDESQSHLRWINGLKQGYNVRADFPVENRKVYQKYGTTFPTRLLVIDKTGPTPAGATVSKTAPELDDVIDLLEGIRNDRTQQPATAQPGTVSNPLPPRDSGTRPDAAPEPSVPAPARPDRPSDVAGEGGATVSRPAGDGVRRPGAAPTGTSAPRPAGPRTDTEPQSRPEPSGTRVPQPDAASPGPVPAGEPVSKPEPAIPQPPTGEQQVTPPEQPAPPPTVTNAAENIERKTSAELTDVPFEPYVPSATFKGAQPHKASLVESAAMAATKAPKLKGKLFIPQSLIDSGALSSAQLEQIARAGDAHEVLNPDGTRAGYIVGDGTGVGKGRTIAGVIINNMLQGHKKAVWVSENEGLFENAMDDWLALGQSEDTLKYIPDFQSVIDPNFEGVIYVPYSTLGMTGLNDNGKTRLQQLSDWLGKDFSGTIAFDEAHNMGNAVDSGTAGSRGAKKASNRAIAGVALQDNHPDARVLYVSATMATEVRNLAYAPRLGLWGIGTQFPSVHDFINEISAAYIAGMEMVSQNLKSFGKYLARSISFNDGTKKGTVVFDRLEHALTEEQEAAYDRMADAWEVVHDNIDAAIAMLNAPKGLKEGAFRNAQLQFFEAVVTSMQMPSVFKSIDANLADNKSIVIQLTKTGDEATKRAVAKKGGKDLEDLQVSPLDMLVQFVRRSFPVEAWTTVPGPNGNPVKVPLTQKDANGNDVPVLDQQAVQMRDALLQDLEDLKAIVPQSALDQIIEHYGTEAVAEVTGREQRLVWTTDPQTGKQKREFKRKGAGFKEKEIQAFLDGRKRILVFSDAGATGKSYHASLKEKNQQQRVHYILQAGWRADKTMQGTGRTHRTDQASAPIFMLCHTNLAGHKRFLSTIARRLAQLGALTKGQRTAGSGIFKESDNLESTEALEALRKFLEMIDHGEVEQISREQFEKITGLKLRGPGGGAANIPMSQFLNRVLAMRPSVQNPFFEAFQDVVDAIVEERRANGTLDAGLETIKASRVVVKEDQVVNVHAETGAETHYVKAGAFNPTVKRTFQQAMRSAGNQYSGVYQNTKGRLFIAANTGRTHTDKQGRTMQVWRLLPAAGDPITANLDEKFYKNITTVTDKVAAEKTWEEQLAKAPAESERTIHLITGAILPVWKLLGDTHTRVMRMRTEDGNTILGRVIPPGAIDAVLRRLGADERGKAAKAMEPGEAFERLVRGDSINLANGWTLARANVSYERRIEVIGPSVAHQSTLQRMGITSERVASKLRFFVPWHATIGPETLGKLFGYSHPVDTDSEVQEGSDFDALKSDRQNVAGSTTAAPGVPKALDALPKSMDGTGVKPPSQVDMVRSMEKFFSVPIRIGRMMGGRTTLGYYMTRPRLVRLRNRLGGHVGVAAHEVAHAIDAKTNVRNGLTYTAKEELKNLDYDQGKHGRRASEGFAEFVRLYLTRPDVVNSHAPEFLAHFESWLAQPENRKWSEGMRRTREMLERWKDAGAGARIGSKIKKTTKERRPEGITSGEYFREQFASMLHRSYAAWKDEAHFLNRFTKDAISQGWAGKVGESPISLYRAYMGNGAHFASDAIENGVFSVIDPTKRIGPSLREVLADIDPAEYDTFVSWVIARHAIEVNAKLASGRPTMTGFGPIGSPTGIETSDARHWFQQHDSARYRKAADKFTEFNNALIQMLEEAGVVKPGTAHDTAKAWDTYVPLHRVRRNAVTDKAGSGRKLVNLPDALHRRKGSDLDILDPFQATIERAVRFYERAAQQVVIDKTIDVAESTYGKKGDPVEGMGKWVVRVPAGKKPTHFSLNEIWSKTKDFLEAQGINRDDLDDMDADTLDEFLTIWRPDYTYKGDQPIARTLRGGEPALYEFDRDLYRFVSGMHQAELPRFLDLTFGAATRLTKIGATGVNLTFAAKNTARDTVTYLMQSKEHGLSNTDKLLLDPVKMLSAYVASEFVELTGGQATNPYVVLFKKMGGEMSTSLGLDQKQMARNVRDLMRRNSAAKAMGIVRNPVDALRKGITISEVAPRLAEFKAVLERYGFTHAKLQAGNMPPRHVLVEAINAAHDVTVDFRRMGYWGKIANQLIPFFNAPLEGADKLIRTYRDNPKRALFMTASMVAATIGYWLAVKDKDWYKEAPAWLKYGFWSLTGPNGELLARIPRPQEWGWWVSASTEAMLNAMADDNPAELATWSKEAAVNTLPGPNFAFLMPALETAFNYDTFRRRKIVPDEMAANNKPETQYFAWNTELSKKIGQYLGISPAKLDHFLGRQTGGLYTNVLRPTEAAMFEDVNLSAADTPLVGGFMLRKEYSQSVDKFYEVRNELKQAKGTAEKKKEEFADARKLSRFDAYAELMGKLRKEIENYADRDKRFEYEKHMIAVARFALGEKELDRYPNPLKAENLSPGATKIRDEFLGGVLYDLTDPPAHPKWNDPEREKKLAARKESIDAARETLRQLNLDDSEANRLLRATAKRHKVQPTSDALTARLSKLRRELAE